MMFCVETLFLVPIVTLCSRYLDMVSEDVMEDLTRYYHRKVPCMSRRVITPFSDGPSKSFLEELTEDTSQINDSLTGESATRKSKTRRRRSRKSVSEDDGRRERKTDRQISISSEKSLLSDEEEENSLADSALHTKKLQITVPVSIPSSKESQAADFSQGSWTAAPKSPVLSPGNFLGNQFASSPPGLSLREIMEEEKSSQQPRVQLRNKKFSWKDAKRQQNQEKKSQSKIREGGLDTGTDPSGNPSQPVSLSAPTKPAWGGINQSVTSFRDLITEDRNQSSHPGAKAQPTLTTPQKPSKHLFSWGLRQTSGSQKVTRQRSVEDSPVTSPQTVDNPWSRAPSVQSPTPATVSFSDIVQDEIQKHESLAQVTSKPLALIQIEELAMQELLRHYKGGDNPEEHITVERVPRKMATPLWTSKSKSATLQ